MLVSPSRLAARLGVSKRHIRSLRAKGLIEPSIICGQVVRYDLESVIESLTEASHGPQWSEEPTFATAHLVAKGSQISLCGAKASMAGWMPANEEQARCPKCRNVTKKKQQ